MLGANVSFTNLPKPNNPLAKEHSSNKSYNHVKSLNNLKKYELPNKKMFESTKISEKMESSRKADRLEIVPAEVNQIKLR